ncbi:MAG: serine/threonine-protein kinase [Ktedonobacteraceae bacterium]
MADRVGERFGNFQLVRLLGEGGFAEVYLGQHIHLSSLVAIKLLHSQLMRHEQEEFLQEARIIASLEHPSIIRVLDCGIEHNTPFLIMNYAPYGTLRQRHPKGTQLSLPEILTYVRQVASALQYAHDRKLIHRDIKPENMLLGPNEEVLLSDFGIALISASSNSQSTKAAAGTVAYMAPEQIMGKPRLASDQYALGIVIYEWLCGERPFKGSFPELCAQHLYAPPPSLKEKNFQVPATVENVVMKALAKEPQQRFASVQDFAYALEQANQQTSSGHTATFITPHAAPGPYTQAPVITNYPVEDNTYLLSRKQTPQGFPLMNISSLPTSNWQKQQPATTGKVADQVNTQQAWVTTTQRPYSVGKSKITGHRWLLIAATVIIVFAIISGSLVYAFRPAPSTPRGATVLVPAKTSTSATIPSSSPVGNATITPSLKLTPASMPSPTSNPTSSPTLTPTSTPTLTPTPSPTPKPVPPTLSVSPAGFVDNFSSCSLDSHGGARYISSCPVVLNNTPQTKSDLNWSASINSSIFVVYPASGTIAPGQSETISFYTTNAVGCPLVLALTVQGSANTIQIPIICTYIDITPNHDAFSNSSCTQNGDWTCNVTVTGNQGNSRNTAWQVQIGDTTGVTFSQTSGTLSPGQTVQVTITIASTDCPGSNTFYFYIPNGHSDYESYLDWSC